MVKYSGANHPFIVWGSCFLWLMSMFSITWSLLLFFCVGDVLYMTGTDLVNAVLLLSGLIMMPANLHMLFAIAKEKRINHRTKVVYCPIWLCIACAIAVNIAGIIICVHRIRYSENTILNSLDHSMMHYRTIPQYKNIMDNLQWALKCCGAHSYKDWFSHDWYDQTRNYEWDPNQHFNKRNSMHKDKNSVTDSVPLSCCKSGTCISNYLNELGTLSINTRGCSKTMNRIIRISMTGHLLVFTFVALLEIMILRYICVQTKLEESPQGNTDGAKTYNVNQIMEAKACFNYSSDSQESDAESPEKYLPEKVQASNSRAKMNFTD